MLLHCWDHYSLLGHCLTILTSSSHHCRYFSANYFDEFFLFASDVSMLFIARGLQGIATGLAVSAIGAAILDFSKLHGSLINSIAPMIGMAVGIFLTCSILQFSTQPLRVVFEFLCFLLILELILSFLTPETAQKDPAHLPL